MRKQSKPKSDAEMAREAMKLVKLIRTKKVPSEFNIHATYAVPFSGAELVVLLIIAKLAEEAVRS